MSAGDTSQIPREKTRTKIEVRRSQAKERKREWGKAKERIPGTREEREGDQDGSLERVLFSICAFAIVKCVSSWERREDLCSSRYCLQSLEAPVEKPTNGLHAVRYRYGNCCSLLFFTKMKDTTIRLCFAREIWDDANPRWPEYYCATWIDEIQRSPSNNSRWNFTRFNDPSIYASHVYPHEKIRFGSIEEFPGTRSSETHSHNAITLCAENEIRVTVDYHIHSALRTFWFWSIILADIFLFTHFIYPRRLMSAHAAVCLSTSRWDIANLVARTRARTNTLSYGSVRALLFVDRQKYDFFRDEKWLSYVRLILNI